jgi:hypothetical protein
MSPTLLEPPRRRRVSNSLYRKWNWRRQVVASGLRLTALVLLVLLGWGGWYLANRGFGREVRKTVADELRKRGVEASIRRLTLDPFRGLVAQDLRIYDFKNRDKPLATISEVSLDINYAALLHRQPFINAIDVRHADVTFPNPGGDPRAPKAQLKQFRAHVYFPPEQIHISQAEGIFCGVRISATGQLIKRHDYRATRVVTDEEWRRRMQLLQSVAAELQAFSYTGDPPTLQVKFSGDLAQMEHAHVEANLRGQNLRRGAYEIRAISAIGEWADRKLTIAQFNWTDTAGEFNARAAWDSQTRLADVQAQSSVNAKGALEALGFGKFVADATFATPPVIEFSGRANTAEPTPRLSGIGRIEIGSFTYQTIPFLGLSADYSLDGQRTMLRDVRVRHASGEVLADLLDAPNDFRLNVQSSLNPAAIRRLAPEGIRNFLGEWEWPRSPAIRMAIRGRSRQPETWIGDGTLTLPRTRFRGVWMNSATADVHFEKGAVSFNDFRIVREEGIGTGSFTYDFANHEVRVRNIHTNLPPTDAMQWIEPKLVSVVTPYKFRAPPKLVANGVVQFKGRKDTRLEIGIDAPTGMDYVFLGETLPFDAVRGNLLITDDRVQLIGMEGALFGGTVRGDADISVASNDKRYSADVAVDGIDFPRLTKLYFDYDTARGELSGNYAFAGLTDNTRTMHGGGKLKVANGSVFAIPVFGPLSSLIAAVIPGAGYSVAKQATASFTVQGGIIRTEDFKVSGKLFGMIGHGDLHFLDNKLDFDMRIDAKGAGVLLTPVYELFEYKGEGSLSKPTWRPKRF